ncbi:MAG TPA: hypothetical protein VE133_04365 [Candidatus Sulfotelmatobacter sp.]|nr:hypothetical protein [Candidatus Sulfotelmatobacter sp.]
MQVLKLYDPNRNPAEWTGLIRPGQFAVFHSDLATDMERTADGGYLHPGEDSTCLIFDSLPKAEAYCETEVEIIPTLRCDIYDHTGKSRPPLLTYVNRAHVKEPDKRVYLGWALIAASVPCFLIEWHYHGTLVVPMVIGVNLIIAGLRIIYWGKGGVEKRRARQTRPASKS